MAPAEVSDNIWQAANPHKNDCLSQENSGAYLCGPLRDWHRLGQPRARVKHLLAHIAYALAICLFNTSRSNPSPSPVWLVLSKQIAQFLVRSIDRCLLRARANQLVSNTFRLLIITLRQAKHQYEGYWRILKDTEWTLGSCSISSNGCSSLPAMFLLVPFSFILWQTWRLLFLSHYYISIYFTKPKLKLKQTEHPAPGALSASGLFIYAICLSARQLITFALPSSSLSLSLLFALMLCLHLARFIDHWLSVSIFEVVSY